MFACWHLGLHRRRPTIRMTEAWGIKWGILVWDTILIFSLFVGCFYHKGPALISRIPNTSLNHEWRGSIYIERVDFLRSICFVNILWVNWTTKMWVPFMYINAIDVWHYQFISVRDTTLSVTTKDNDNAEMRSGDLGLEPTGPLFCKPRASPLHRRRSITQ